MMGMGHIRNVWKQQKIVKAGRRRTSVEIFETGKASDMRGRVNGKWWRHITIETEEARVRVVLGNNCCSKMTVVGIWRKWRRHH